MPLPLNLQKLGERQGFEDGWSDAMKGLARKPRPNVGYDLFDARYLKSYAASYRDGHEFGNNERIRKEKLIAHRKRQNDQESEREQ